jgi:hypothetical protein
MKFVGAVTWVLVIGALSGGGTTVLASEVAADDIAEVTVVASRLGTRQPHCRDVSKIDARSQAAEASRQGDHQRAAECYLKAGDPVRADRAYLKATRLAAAESAQRFAASNEAAREQARRIRATFKGR